MDMTDKKMYIFSAEDSEDADVTVIFATSFDEAVLIYSIKRPKDYATQSIYWYGVFDDMIEKDEEDDPDSTERRFNTYKHIWQICEKTPTKTDEFGVHDVHNLIKRRVYDGGRYGFTITVTELPIQEFQVVSHITAADAILDKVQIMKNAKKRFDEIYHPDKIAEERKHIENSIYDEISKINVLVAERIKYKKEMFKHPSDSEEYKAAKKKVDDLKKEINRLFGENDDILINFKENENGKL